jgi:HTH-type transcriptional regulator/antitoxin HigA
MRNELKPIQTEADYDAALAEVERLWGAKSATPGGDRLDALATLIDAYEARHYPMDLPEAPNGETKSAAKEPSP